MLSFQTQQEPLMHDQVALIVSPSGDIDDRTAKQFEQQLQDYLKVGYRFVILNCAGLRSINSSGLEILLKMVETYHHEAGGIFLLMQVQVLPQISKFFDMLGFSPIFTSFTNKQEAVNYLAAQIKNAFESEQEDGRPKNGITSNFPAAVPARKDIPTLPAVPPSQTPVANVDKASAPAAPVKSNPNPFENNAHAAFSREPKLEKRLLTSDLPLEIEIQYYKRMLPLANFHMAVAIQSSNQSFSGGSTVNVAPHFPGCLVVPPSRTVDLRKEVKLNFWVTPLTTRKIEGWLELGVEKDKDTGHSLPLPVKVTNYLGAKLLLLLAVISLILWQWTPPLLQDAMDKFALILAQFVRGDVRLLVCGLLVVMSLLAYLICRPRKTKLARQIVWQRKEEK